ncbi:binding partner of ACD11 1-like isoform X2 [Malania oleifera]|uniref:binding partner of ACD11 1-like isoform X2 n=1 Tax=Malania oleifera TaxID=397392 RepID=UPI0025AEC06B|nr:binding partner of ACD11 1-like isoform X2 [Malania oleifera]XP_057961445.1 binding partner of ACD11 1-like isoform X2 [Malania oleifera]XP_057961453.1 binding partner of ACD11 1-like isoform X2 [Malania oleifera]XP_057961459.1 binding partner of ACD11 1-like isoform X2 [Malania oleifera]XP_057961467.1 binding partner of ACD11 1-like isoform X2 [Malania oleifera]XP_057961474.1 binding partner of ACD11 1-like isoform X2 [Malania oleifera]
MYSNGYTAEVTSLPARATEKDVYDFFIHCGIIDHIEIIRAGEYACSAYVTFKDAYALETAILLSGAKIVDQCVHISRWRSDTDETFLWDEHSWKLNDENSSMATHLSQHVSTPGEAVTVAQEVVKTMVAKGYVLGKDALIKAKALDESYQISATAAAKVAGFSDKIGLTEKICVGMEVVKSVDERYHVSSVTKSAAVFTGRAAVTTGRTAAAAANAVVNSSYFAKGALWVSDVLTHAAKVAADVGHRGSEK